MQNDKENLTDMQGESKGKHPSIISLYLNSNKHIIPMRQHNKLLIHYFWDVNSGESWGENVYTTARKEHFGHVGYISRVNW